MKTFSEKLIADANKYLQIQLKSNFLVGITEGTLEEKRFNYWLKVDYPYLINFLRVISIGKAKAEDEDDYSAMMHHAQGVEDEMLDHQKHANNNDLSLKDISNPNAMGPLKYSYTRHQLSTAYSGDIGDLQASMLCCMWSYQHLAREIKNKYNKQNNPYTKWIAYHSDEKHLEGFELACNLIDRKAEKYGIFAQERMKNIFFISVYHETALWEEYYNMTTWDDLY